jgi:3'-phosphoadenosine 5'-phosphosulfate (PAPS) 3'-phosphatase
MRGEHYCIALGLVVNNTPVLSVLGCPNLQLNNVLNRNNIASIIEPSNININDNNDNLDLFSPLSGSIYYAIKGRGAYARSLSMQPNDYIQVHVSNKSTISDMTLTESKESSHGSRELTIEIRKLLELNNEYMRIDGQCKHCIVGSGSVEGNLRLPKAGYIENVFDHMPGCHFIKEAGGYVSDLNGNEIDYSLGKYLSDDVTGIVSSNRILHNVLLETISKAKINIK